MPLSKAVLIALVCAATGAYANPSDYGKVDSFQPGKKYNCVPTTDRKGWDCQVTGRADIPPATATPPAAAPEPPRPATPPSSTPESSAPAAPAPAQAGALPGYLTNSAANGAMQPLPAAPAAKPAPKPRVKGPQVPAQTPSAPAASLPPAPVKPVAPAPEPAPAVATPPAQAGHDFLALPPAQYVIELAHADSAAGLDAARAAARPAHGEVYELHLSQNENEAWLLLWGPFENLESARSARAELAAQGATPGWPRRIGPLQTEAQRARP